MRPEDPALRELAEAAGLTQPLVEFQLYARCPPWGRLHASTRQHGARVWEARVWGDVTVYRVILEVGGVGERGEPFGLGPGPWRVETWVESLGVRPDSDRTRFREALERGSEAADHHWATWLDGDRWALVRQPDVPRGHRFLAVLASPIGAAFSPGAQDLKTRSGVLVPAYLHADGAPVWAENVPCEQSAESTPASTEG
jgi:hypothetical protein